MSRTAASARASLSTARASASSLPRSASRAARFRSSSVRCIGFVVLAERLDLGLRGSRVAGAAASAAASAAARRPPGPPRGGPTPPRARETPPVRAPTRRDSARRDASRRPASRSAPSGTHSAPPSLLDGGLSCLRIFSPRCAKRGGGRSLAVAVGSLAPRGVRDGLRDGRRDVARPRVGDFGSRFFSLSPRTTRRPPSVPRRSRPTRAVSRADSRRRGSRQRRRSWPSTRATTTPRRLPARCRAPPRREWGRGRVGC